MDANNVKLNGAPRILVTNDDGIHAPGIAALERIARRLSDDVWVVAPQSEQSGASRSLTLHDPLRVRQLEAQKYSVEGTPTDCVLMAVNLLIEDKRPDLVLSGVNRGANMAEDVTYSGTVAGAMEGTMIGIPSVALSQAMGFQSDGKLRLETAEAYGPAIIARLFETGWPENVLININFPDRDPDAVERIEVTSQGQRDQANLKIDARADPRGTPYYWYGIERKLSNPPEGTDLKAIYSGRISVTPLHLNLTERGTLESLSEALKAPLKVPGV